MPTLTWLDSFQHQTSSPTFYGTNAGLWDNASTTSQMSAVAGRRAGTYALQIAADGVNAVWVRKDVAAGIKVLVESFYFRITAKPTVSGVFWLNSSAGPTGSIGMQASNGNLTYTTGSGSTDPRLVTGDWSDGLWHRIDLKMDRSANPHTLDIQVDGVAQTQQVSASAAPADISVMRFGTTGTAGTLTTQLTDWVRSVTGADYPIGAHRVDALIPTADGTHSWASTNMGNESGGTTSSVSTLYQSVDDWASAAADTTTYIAYTNTTATSSEYAEITLADASGSPTVWAARAVAAIFSQATSANAATTRVVDGSGTTVSDLYVGDQSDTSPRYQATLLSSITDVTSLNALKYRVGFPTDSNPAPRWSALMIDYATAGDTLNATVTSVLATATADALVPTLKVTDVPAQDAATAASNTPTIVATVVAPQAAATGAAFVPVVAPIPALVAAATGAALIPTIVVTVVAPQAAASAVASASTTSALLGAPQAAATGAALVTVGPVTVGAPQAAGTAVGFVSITKILVEVLEQARQRLAVIPSGADSTDGTTFVTAGTITPAQNRMAVLYIGVKHGVTAAAPTSVTGLGLTWESAVAAVGATRSVFIYVAKTGATPSAGAVTVVFSSTEASFLWTYAEYDADLSGSASDAILQSANAASGGSALTVTLPSGALSAPDNVALAAIVVNSIGTADDDGTMASAAALSEVTTTVPDTLLSAWWVRDNHVGWTFEPNGATGVIAELKAPLHAVAAADTDLPAVRPILIEPIATATATATAPVVRATSLAPQDTATAAAFAPTIHGGAGSGTAAVTATATATAFAPTVKVDVLPLVSSGIYNTGLGGNIGDTVTVPNSDDDAQGSAWDTVSIGGTSTMTYDNVAPIGRCITFAKANNQIDQVVWVATLVDSSTQYGRCYLQFPTLPSSTAQIVVGYVLGGSNPANRVQVTSTGTVQLVSSNTNVVATSSTVLAVATVYRFEWKLVRSGAVGSWDLSIFAGESTTPLETMSPTGFGITNNPITEVRFGNVNGTGTAWTSRMRGFAVNQTALPGPFVGTLDAFALAVPPVVNARSVAPIAGASASALVATIPLSAIEVVPTPASASAVIPGDYSGDFSSEFDVQPRPRVTATGVQAAASAQALAPVLNGAVGAPIAGATAAAVAPTIRYGWTVLAPMATAVADTERPGLNTTNQLTVLAPASNAVAVALVPAVQFGYRIAVPVLAAAIAAAFVPETQEMGVSAAAAASAIANVPTISTRTFASQFSATAAALEPDVIGVSTPIPSVPMAEAVASALAPVVLSQTAIAFADALIPVVVVGPEAVTAAVRARALVPLQAGTPRPQHDFNPSRVGPRFRRVLVTVEGGG